MFLSLAVLGLLVSFPFITKAQTTSRSTTTVLSTGAEGADVAKVQQILIDKGLLILPPNITTGYYGNLTTDAVSKYQAQVNIPQTGVLDSATQTAIGVKVTATAATPVTPTYTPPTPTVLTPTPVYPTPTPADNGCSNGEIYSSTTGQACFPPGCTSFSGYSQTTGLACNGSQTSFPAGCTSNIGYSSTTGLACNGSQSSFPAGCTSFSGYSSTTGLACNGSVITPTPTPTSGHHNELVNFEWISTPFVASTFAGVESAKVYSTCPNDKVLLGGGYSLYNNPGSQLRVSMNGPVSNNMYGFAVNGPLDSITSGNIYITCADIMQENN